MRTLVIGCNHRTAPVALRERLAFSEAEIDDALRTFHLRFPNAEAVLISTCNRIELYVVHPIYDHPRIAEAIEFLAGYHGLEAPDVAEAFYSFEDTEAVRHLFRVVCSLDSMVLGESQILSQARQAFDAARSAGSVGRSLGDLFQRAFAVAKDAHTRTAIAAGRVSIGSAAVDLARQIFSHFNDKIVFMIGAGKMGEVTLTHLLATQPRELWITNRTDQRAFDTAERIHRRHGVQARVVPFCEWVDRLAEVDIVISSTGSRDPILTAEQFVPIPARRRYRSLLIIDIAVPRDIDPEIGKHDSVYLFNIDDLQLVTEATVIQRRGAVERCQAIIEANVVEFMARHSSSEVGPLIDAFKRHLDQIAGSEIEWLLPKLEQASAHDRELICQLLHRVIQKVLHDPVMALRNPPSEGLGKVYADTLRTMFNLISDKNG